MKRVLLTGAGGFIGRHAIAALLVRGYEVHAVTSGTGGYPWESSGKVIAHSCDLLDGEMQRKLFQVIRPSHLLHFAWYTAHGKFWTAPENVKWVAASTRLLDNFVACGGKRVVFTGTCAEYEWKDEVFCESTTALQPASLYGICKNSLQSILSATTASAGISSAWGRIFFLYGPFENPSRFVPNAILPMLKGEPAQFSHCRQIRDFMHVEDVAGAFAATLDSDFQGPINIASGLPITLRHIVDVVVDILRRPDLIRIGVRPESPGDPARLVADVANLRDVVKFAPKYTLETGLMATIRWWEKNAAEITRSVPKAAAAPIEPPTRDIQI